MWKTPPGGDGVGLVAAAGRVGDDRSGRAEPSRPGGDVGPAVARAAAAGLGDEDLAADGAGVEEVVEVADAARAVGSGAPKARAGA